MNRKLTMRVIAVVLLVAGGVYFAFGRGSGATRPAAASSIDQATAVSLALDAAHMYGFQAGKPDSCATQQMTLDQYNNLEGNGASGGNADLGLDPKQLVWVITMKGAVDWVGPGRASAMCPQCDPSQDKFDNMTVVLDLTGDQIATSTAGPGHPLPIKIPSSGSLPESGCYDLAPLSADAPGAAPQITPTEVPELP